MSRSSTAAYWPVRPMRARTARGFGDDVDAVDDGRPAVGPEQRGEDAHRGGLAGPVRAEQTEHGAAGDREVDAAQGLGVAEALDEALRFHSWTG